MKKLHFSLYPFIFLTIVFGSINPAIVLYFTVAGWPAPKYITHGPLYTRPAASIQEWGFFALLFVLIVTVIHAIILITSKRKMIVFVQETVLIGVQVVLLFISLVMMIGTVA